MCAIFRCQTTDLKRIVFKTACLYVKRMSFPKFAVFIKAYLIGSRYTVISRKVVGKNVHATIPKGNMGYDQYTVPNDCSCRTYFGCFPLTIASITSQTSCIIHSNFFEEQCTQNHPQQLPDCRLHFFRQPFSK